MDTKDVLCLAHLAFIGVGVVVLACWHFKGAHALMKELCGAIGSLLSRKVTVEDATAAWMQSQLDLLRLERAQGWLVAQAVLCLGISARWSIKDYMGIPDVSHPGAAGLLLQSGCSFVFAFIPLTPIRINLMYTISMSCILTRLVFSSYAGTTGFYVFGDMVSLGYAWAMMDWRKAAIGNLALCAMRCSQRAVFFGVGDSSHRLAEVLFLEVLLSILRFFVVVSSEWSARDRLRDQLREHSSAFDAQSFFLLLKAQNDVVLRLEDGSRIAGGELDKFANFVRCGQAGGAEMCRDLPLTTYINNADSTRFASFIANGWKASQLPSASGPPCDMAAAIHMHLQCCDGVAKAVELFHVPTRDVNGLPSHLLGIREVSDAGGIPCIRGSDGGGIPCIPSDALLPLPSEYGNSSGVQSRENDSGADLPSIVLRFQAFEDTAVLEEFRACYSMPGDSHAMMRSLHPAITEMIQGVDGLAFSEWLSGHLITFASSGITNSSLEDVNYKFYVPCIGHVEASKAEVHVRAEVGQSMPWKFDLELQGTTMKPRTRIVSKSGVHKSKNHSYRHRDGELTGMVRAERAASRGSSSQPPSASSELGMLQVEL
eukprot:TRINITY_DN92491_c0_g1_i1.p1 TRINITY_DN92491_c0_g1~~TRINITY_DN92491_c0_g1_i1.p1  ORF type:complete len:599 (+),score=75.11 TRINITY_DN92491_c0_g1_i1:187-1983(+)